MTNERILEIILQVAAILLFTKLFGLVTRKLGLPEVVGAILAGLLLGTAIWGKSGWIFPIEENTALKVFSKIGVLLILFKAGLETDLKAMKRLGFLSFLIALGGVLVPLGFGFLLGFILLPSEGWQTWIFVGTIMTATSVGITVETLKSMGKLQTKVGSLITAAAIIDDVIGMICLTVTMSFSGTDEGQNAVLEMINPNNYPWVKILWMFVFFAVAIGLGALIVLLFKRINRVKPNVHRVPIYSLATCFLYAFLAENVFGVADITGAYFAGAILSVCHSTAEYADRKIDVGSYMFFSPLFFAYIGIQISFSAFSSWSVVLLSVLFVALAILGKIVGAGGVAKLAGMSTKDSLKIGIGMIARGEVALAVTTTGIDAGLFGTHTEYIAMTVLLVLVSSILAPVLLKLLYKNDPKDENRFEEAEGNYE